MKIFGQTVCLALAPTLAVAHEGIDPESVVHTIAHLGESYGLIVAIPVAVAIAVVLQRRRATAKSTPVQ